MHVTSQKPSSTEAVLYVSADGADLAPHKETVLQKLQPQVNLPGFRKGTAPLSLVEKNVDPTLLQTEFLEEAISSLYAAAIQQEKLRPVARPEIDIKKFVPFNTLEFEARVPILGRVKLADYKKLKKTKPEAKVTAKDVEEVLQSLRKRVADKKDVNRPAKAGDQAWIDFRGVNEKGQPVNGAEGQDYPLLLGSQTFIPGFEDNLIGLKAGDEKTFTLTFPKDYGVKALANKNVTFTVTVTKVQEVVDPKLDDAFAKQVGPFESLDALKVDIKKQVEHERRHELDRNFESELVSEIASKSQISFPDVLTEDQMEVMLKDLRQNLNYRGQTWAEFLSAEGKTEEEYKKDVLRPQAEQRVKASLVLAEIAEAEGIEVTPEELEVRIQLLKSQYQDNAMQDELKKPEARRDIAARLLTEKTVMALKKYVGALN